MTEFLFFKESPSNLFRSKELQNVCVVGQDGNGWTSELLLGSLSPWIKELLSSLPPYSDHCIILPDITWKDISGFFQSHALLNSLLQNQPLQLSGDLFNMFKVSDGTETLSKYLTEQLLSIQKVINSQNGSQDSIPTNQNQCIKKEEFQTDLTDELEKQEESLEGSESSMRVLKVTERTACKNRKQKRLNRKPYQNKTKYCRSQLYKIMKSSKIDSYNLDTIEGITLSPCDKCEKKCLTPTALKKHKEKAHPIVHTCEYCPYSAKGERLLKLHLHSSHKEVLASCDVCDKKYSGPNSLRRHKLSHHVGIRFPCDRCEYKAKNKKCLKNHINAIHEKITVLCDMCNKIYTLQRNLEQHQASVHKGIFYLCDQCDYKGTQRRNLQRHIEKAHEVK